MRLDEEGCRRRLEGADHGVLATVHPERGVDAVPCAFAALGDLVAVPVDTVKPKASTRLQRQRNLDLDPRATLLVEHWEAEDWSRLWWVRASLRREPGLHAPTRTALEDALAVRYVQYRSRPFAALEVLRITGLAGWSAGPP